MNDDDDADDERRDEMSKTSAALMNALRTPGFDLETLSADALVLGTRLGLVVGRQVETRGGRTAKSAKVNVYTVWSLTAKGTRAAALAQGV